MTKIKRRFYLKEFKAISHAISTYDDLNLLISHISEGTARTFGAVGCSILLLDERERQLVTVGSFGLSDEYLRKGPIVVDEKECAFATGKPLYVEDVMADPSIQYPDAAKKEGIGSMLSVPIKSRRNVIGILRIYSPPGWQVAEEDVESLSVLSEQFGLVIENNGLKNFLDQVKFAVDSLPLRLLEDA